MMAQKLESTDNSMINAFIPPKARLVVSRSLTPQNGDIVVAIMNGMYTIKYLKKNDIRCWLIYLQTENTGR
ncbi:MAG: S24 family peptidase [Bacteroidota bacterium]